MLGVGAMWKGERAQQEMSERQGKQINNQIGKCGSLKVRETTRNMGYMTEKQGGREKTRTHTRVPKQKQRTQKRKEGSVYDKYGKFDF